MYTIDALLRECERGNIELVKEIVESGIDINIRKYPWWSVHLYSAIEIASQFNKFEIVKYLVENGADISVDDHFPLRVACSDGYTEIVKYLVDQGSDVTDKANYAMIKAFEEDRVEVVEYFYSVGVYMVSNPTGKHYFSKEDTSETTSFFINFLKNEKKKVMLFSLLNQYKRIGIVHKDLSPLITSEVAKHKYFYNRV